MTNISYNKHPEEHSPQTPFAEQQPKTESKTTTNPFRNRVETSSPSPANDELCTNRIANFGTQYKKVIENQKNIENDSNHEILFLGGKPLPRRPTAKVENVENTKTENIHKSPESFAIIFKNSTPQERNIIYSRMVDFAKECGIEPDEMAAKVVEGHKVAQQIANLQIKDTHPTEDLINLDWFLRAQMAKMDALFMHGTVKFPDPNNKFATFINNTQSTFHGSIQKPKGRWSSHWPECIEKIIKHR